MNAVKIEIGDWVCPAGKPEQQMVVVDVFRSSYSNTCIVRCRWMEFEIEQTRDFAGNTLQLVQKG